MSSQNVARATWRKSSRSNGAGGACVEVASLETRVGIRDSKAPDAGHLTLAPDTWAAFMAEARNGRFDLP